MSCAAVEAPTFIFRVFVVGGSILCFPFFRFATPHGRLLTPSVLALSSVCVACTGPRGMRGVLVLALGLAAAVVVLLSMPLSAEVVSTISTDVVPTAPVPAPPPPSSPSSSSRKKASASAKRSGSQKGRVDAESSGQGAH